MSVNRRVSVCGRQKKCASPKKQVVRITVYFAHFYFSTCTLRDAEVPGTSSDSLQAIPLELHSCRFSNCK